MKRCSKCHETFEFGLFNRSSRSKDGFTAYCKKCAVAAAGAWAKENKARRSATNLRYSERHRDEIEEQRRLRRAANPDLYKTRQRDYARRNRLKSYGLTEEALQAKLEAQQGGCAICERHITLKTLHVDHCHTTGGTRDLLCTGCNTGLGHIEKSGFVAKAIAYLERHRSWG